MKVHVLQTGSQGNCTLIECNDNSLIMIDCGIGIRKFEEHMQRLNKKIEDIKLILVTHSHVDHYKEIYRFNNVITYLPFHLTEKYKNKLETKENFEIRQSNSRVILNKVPFYFKEYKITPIKVNHDCEPTYSFVIQTNLEKLSLITDTGFIHEEVFDYYFNSDIFLIESNHDENMLLNSKREYPLIKRIMSDKGHLSNTQCAVYLTKLVSDKTKYVVLIHLSEECNTPLLATQAYYTVFNDILGIIPENLHIEKLISTQKDPVDIDTLVITEQTTYIEKD